MISSRNAVGALGVLLLCYFCGALTYFFSPEITEMSSKPQSFSSSLEDPQVPVTSASASVEIQIYLGAGCFWHVQHELIRFEQDQLRRSANMYTSIVGYAGGRDMKTQPCYHNLWNVNDYNTLGHTEVVAMRIPMSKLTDLANFYFEHLLVNGDRVDTQDKGPEYRSVIGVPGGIHGLYGKYVEAARHGEVDIVEGEGNDPDTLRQGKVFVMDSDAFPFFQGEVYHQFHDDMVEKYSPAYHRLKRVFLDSGRLRPVPPCSDDDI